MRIKKLSLCVITAALVVSAASPDRGAKNSINVEGLGSAGLYSVNYERMVTKDIGARIGFGYTSITSEASATDGSVTVSSESTTKSVSIPIIASYNGVSNGKSSLELGFGPTLNFNSTEASAGVDNVSVSGSGDGNSVHFNTIVGYRLQPTNGGFQFRVGFNGLFGKGLDFSSMTSGEYDSEKFGFLPFFHISLGGTFGGGNTSVAQN